MCPGTTILIHSRIFFVNGSTAHHCLIIGRLLFQPNNEHRMVIGKLVTLFYYGITGHLNFTFLHIAGACFTLGTLWLFWTSF